MDAQTAFGASRRHFLKTGSLLLSAAAVGPRAVRAGTDEAADPALRIGLLTDVHYADREPAGSRYYRESLAKMREAAGKFRAAGTDFVVELGDLIDAADSVETELGYLKAIDGELSSAGQCHYVLGNHCVHTLTKDEFIEGSGARKPFYSFDQAGLHFVVLDACFRADGQPYGRKNFDWTDTNIHPDELDWLAGDLARAPGPTIVFVHQRLDTADHYGIRNAADVRQVLDGSGKVRAVFQGHNHVNDLKRLGDVHYITLAAVVEGSGAKHSAYGILEIGPDGALRLEGFRTQKDYSL